MEDFAELAAATERARALTGERAHALALQAGASEVELAHSQSRNSVDHDLDGHVFFEAAVTATASGAPSLRVEAAVAS